ncbi:hypothetical protein PHMEG_00027926 [Phytophthora megakarya]|uniref:ZSWIM1/3 RNaseH-like domain-containing protein n=1 Tax=Phytophthora megakarya TaxID=4795 RepID=A0A225V7S3_9STRA|nr:hypothetical protein PHMEG_00027926 [Phytophthora megakarya]
MSLKQLLVVTVATGRGASVLDFLCINQRKDTLKDVLSFFKKINPTWKNIESLVIDKDFTEMAALQEEFPGAMIFLCQFHAIKYVKQMIHSHKYDVSRNKRDDAEDLFRAMLFAPSQERYNARKHIFEQEVVKMTPFFSNYFARYWATYSKRWSNYGRRHRFSAGNTTTNRIEASWNQFKQLLGKKTSMDKCLQVVFKQQACVLRDLEYTVATFRVNAPSVTCTIAELRGVARVLSRYCFRRVLSQWDYHIMFGNKWFWNCTKQKSGDTYKFVTSLEEASKISGGTRVSAHAIVISSCRQSCRVSMFLT